MKHCIHYMKRFDMGNSWGGSMANVELLRIAISLGCLMQLTLQ